MVDLLKRGCPDECDACGGRDYVSAAVLEEAQDNARREGRNIHEEGFWPCPRTLQRRLEQAEATLKAVGEAIACETCKGTMLDFHSGVIQRPADMRGWKWNHYRGAWYRRCPDCMWRDLEAVLRKGSE